MNLQKFSAKLNWRFIAIHLLATILLTLGARRLAVLSDIEIIEVITKYSVNQIWEHIPPGSETIGDRLAFIFLWTSLAYLAAGFISFIISFIISRRNKIYWLNPFLVLVLTIIVCKSRVLNSDAVKTVSDAPGTLFDGFGTHYSYLVNGIVCSVTGLILFFNPWTKRMIRKQYPEEHFAPKVPVKEEWIWD